MFGRFTHLSLIATALAPILLTLAAALRARGIVGEMPVGDGASVPIGGWSASLVVLALVLVAVCTKLLSVADTKLMRFPFSVATVESADQDILAFLVAYLLPLAAMTTTTDGYDWVTALVAFALISAVVFQSGLAHVNPLIGLLGWRFYKVATSDGCTFLLISKRNLAEVKKTSAVVQISSSMVMTVGVGA